MEEFGFAAAAAANRVRRLLPVAGALLVPLALVPSSWADAIAEAVEWIGNGRVMALAAAANALMIIF